MQGWILILSKSVIKQTSSTKVLCSLTQIRESSVPVSWYLTLLQWVHCTSKLYWVCKKLLPLYQERILYILYSRYHFIIKQWQSPYVYTLKLKLYFPSTVHSFQAFYNSLKQTITITLKNYGSMVLLFLKLWTKISHNHSISNTTRNSSTLVSPAGRLSGFSTW